MVRDNEDLPAPSIKTPAELVEMLKRDVDEFNDWREANPNVVITMQGVNFSRCNLLGANLHGAILEQANFFCANLAYVDLTDAKLDGANFTHADLWKIKADALTRDVITTQLMGHLFRMKASWR